jgi:ATP-dependent RNA helicase HelY
LWAGLSPDQLAAALSTLVFESRRDDDGQNQHVPEGELGDALMNMVRTWGELKDVESQNRVDHLREMDPGFIWPTSRWARGQSIARVLKNSDLQPGDFVRWTKQVIDLLGQVAIATDDEQISKTARAALESIDRGIVSW